MPWVKVDDHFDEHPKHAMVGPLGWGVWAAGLAYCNRNLTDGFIPRSVALTLASFEVVDPEGRVWKLARTSGMVGEDIDAEWVIGLLLEAGLWEVAPGGYRVHDYLEYQPSKAHVLEERHKVRERVQRHRQKRREPAGNGDGNIVGNTVTNVGVTPTPVPVPVPDTEPPREKNSSSAPSGADKQRRRHKVIPEDSDAYRLAVHLRDTILARDPETKVPSNLNGWAVEADRLLRLDKRDLEEAMRLIEWCQRDSFWSANVLSMATFRRQYDKLKRKAEAEMASARASPQRRQSYVWQQLGSGGVLDETG